PRPRLSNRIPSRDSPSLEIKHGGHLKLKMWLGPESNRRHADFQSAALPTELPSRGRCRSCDRVVSRVVTKAENPPPSNYGGQASKRRRFRILAAIPPLYAGGADNGSAKF